LTKDSEKKIAAIYCRVSTFEQGQGDFSSLKGQEDLLEEY
jgi:DNA invertase Pin-like site-specific DNA recombinase